jgi:hypothetical protein
MMPLLVACPQCPDHSWRCSLVCLLDVGPRWVHIMQNVKLLRTCNTQDDAQGLGHGGYHLMCMYEIRWNAWGKCSTWSRLIAQTVRPSDDRATPLTILQEFPHNLCLDDTRCSSLQKEILSMDGHSRWLKMGRIECAVIEYMVADVFTVVGGYKVGAF